MRVLLLGGTGALGNHLASKLNEVGFEIFITSRSIHKSNCNVHFLHGNAKEENFLKRILNEKWDVVVDFMVYTEIEFFERVDLLLESTTHYIFLSSSRVYDESDRALTEKSIRLLDSSLDKEFLSTNEYALSKARQENILVNNIKKNWTIIRPYISYSSNRLQLGTLEKENWLYRALKGRTIIFSSDMMDKTTTMTYGLDVARGIASILNKTDTYGMTYHITSEKNYKWSQILDIYLDTFEKVLGYKPNVILQDDQDFYTWNRQKYQLIYDRLFDRVFDNTAIKKFITTENFTDVNEGLRICLEDFIKDPSFLSINWKYEALKDKFSDEKTPISEISGIKQKVKYILYRYIF